VTQKGSLICQSPTDRQSGTDQHYLLVLGALISGCAREPEPVLKFGIDLALSHLLPQVSP